MNEGKKDRRDPIRTIKPRNFVAKNAGTTTSGAGAHKDKKKASTQVRGAKHKKQEYAEHLESLLDKVLSESFDFCRVCGCSPCNCTHIVAEGHLGNMLSWPEVVNKVNSAMKATGWKGQRKDDDSYMFSTAGRLDDEDYFVIISNVGKGYFEYALGTVEEGDPRIGEKEFLPMTLASVSELMDAIRDGFGLNEGEYDNDKGIKHTRESLVAKLEALPKGNDEFEWHKNRAIYHLKQGNMLRARYYMAKMKRGEQGVAEGKETINIGDDVVIIGNSAYAGVTGRVIGFREGKIVVDMLEQGKVRFSPERVKLYPLNKQGVAEGFLGDREYNRVMPFVKRIASEVSDYDRDEFGEELWSLLDQKYGPKFAQSVLDDIDFYWDTYTELTDQQGVAEGIEDTRRQDAIFDTVKRLFHKNEIGDYGALEAIRQGIKHHFSKPGATVESAIDGILNILDKRRNKGDYYLELTRFKEALRQGVAHQLKKQGVAEGGEWDEYTGGDPFPDSDDDYEPYGGEHDVDESSGIEYRGFDIRTSRDYITGEVVYWIYYRGRCTEHGNLTLDGAKKDIDYMIAAGFFNDPDEIARKKQQGVAEGWGAERQARELEASNAAWREMLAKYEKDPKMSEYLKMFRVSNWAPEKAEAGAKDWISKGKPLPSWYTNPKPVQGYKLSEDDDMEKLNAWKQEVLKAYPQIAGKVKFKGIGNQISAEVPGLDRSFGVFDLETMSGDVLGETRVRWTHDSLADQLFEHERTYEEELTNKLAKLLNRK